MNPTSWLQRWLLTHPLKEPTHHDPSRFTGEIMERIRAIQRPQTAPAATPWLSWPRTGMVFASVAAGVLIAVVLTQRSNPPQATLMLAESPSSDEEWLQHTMELLELLDEDESLPLEDDELSNTDDEEWLNELNFLDEHTTETRS